MPEVFGHMPDGTPVQRIHLRAGSLQASILTLGAIVQDLRMDGVPHPLVLGADTLEPYLGPMHYFGATVGRFANRIAEGRFNLNGKSHQLSRNFRGRHCLHGGTVGSAERIWSVTQISDDSATLSLSLPDGDMGFPGHLDAILTISLQDGALNFEITAKSDRDTVCSFSHHGYFILDDSGSLAHHRLQIAAEHYLPVDDDLIPTGDIAAVANTDFDFRTPRGLQDVALDHNFCTAQKRESLRPVASLWSDLSGLGMRVASTEPGLQVYTAKHLPQEGVTGHDGRPLGKYAGIALESQAWPDAPNQPQFPSAILMKDTVYNHTTRYEFSTALTYHGISPPFGIGVRSNEWTGSARRANEIQRRTALRYPVT